MHRPRLTASWPTPRRVGEMGVGGLGVAGTMLKAAITGPDGLVAPEPALHGGEQAVDQVQARPGDASGVFSVFVIPGGVSCGLGVSARGYGQRRWLAGRWVEVGYG